MVFITKNSSTDKAGNYRGNVHKLIIKCDQTTSVQKRL